MDNNSMNKGPKEAVWELLKRNARKLSMAYDMSSICQEYGIDERDACEYLSTAEIDDEYKDDIRRRFKRRSELFIRASDIDTDGQATTMTIDQVRGLFKVISDIYLDVCEDHINHIPGSGPSKIAHLHDRGIRPDLLNDVSEILSRLSLYIVNSIPWISQGYVPAPDDPSSIFNPVDPNKHKMEWIREHGTVRLETSPGQYESVKCAVIFDEWAELLAKTMADEESEEMVMPGIAKAFDPWFDTDDATLSYIIRHHCLPEGRSRVLYRGKNKADAVRFWKAIGMTPAEWNQCFRTIDGKPIKPSASKNNLFKDQDKNSGIYVPLWDFALIKS